MTKVRQALGEWGERVAAAHLVAQGMVLLDRHWRTAEGEIDIIARDGDDVVFCEVKTRRGKAFGAPAEAVDDRKARRLRLVAGQWLSLSGIKPRAVRFDVVSVEVQRGGPPLIDHIRNAF